MKKITNLLTVLIIVVYSNNISAQSSACCCEVRGAWLNPEAFNSTTKQQETLQKLIDANLNTLFVAVPPINNNYGWSDSTNFIRFISMAHDSGFSVHIWVANFWREGSTPVDFRDTIEQQLQVQWVMDLLDTYGDYVDGIHFDYIRYTEWEDVNLEGKMDAVTQTVASCYNSIKNQYPDKYLTATSFNLEPNYANFNDKDSTDDEDIPQWFLDWFYANPGNLFETFYSDFSTVPNHMKYQQNPVGWVQSSIVDGVMPMHYEMNDSIWNLRVDLYKSFLDTLIEKIYMGLGWFEDAGSPECGYDPAGIVRKINYGRSHGLKGFVIFELGGDGVDDTPLINALTIDSEVNNYDAPFKNYLHSCLTNSSTGIKNNDNQLAEKYKLFQNIPNPFNSTTKISYSIDRPSYIEIIIYNIWGRKMKTLIGKFQNAGTYFVNFDASELASGTYFYKLQIGNEIVETKKMVLIR